MAKFPEGGHWINTKKLNDRFASRLKTLNLPTGIKNGYVIHSLRHSFETICVNGGIPQRVVDAWLGDTSDRSMAAVYYRLGALGSTSFLFSSSISPSSSSKSSPANNCSSVCVASIVT